MPAFKYLQKNFLIVFERGHKAHGYMRFRSVRLIRRPSIVSPGGACEQFLEIRFPHWSDRVSAVASGLRAHRHDDGTALRYALDLTLENSKLRWIDEIVGRVDGKKWRPDLVQIRTGIVVVRGFDLI